MRREGKKAWLRKLTAEIAAAGLLASCIQGTVFAGEESGMLSSSLPAAMQEAGADAGVFDENSRIGWESTPAEEGNHEGEDPSVISLSDADSALDDGAREIETDSGLENGSVEVEADAGQTGSVSDEAVTAGADSDGSCLIEEETAEEETESGEIVTYYTGSFDTQELFEQGILPLADTVSKVGYTSSFGIQLKQSGMTQSYDIYSRMVQHYIKNRQWTSLDITFSTPYSTSKVTSGGSLTQEGQDEFADVVTAGCEAFFYDYPDYYVAGMYGFGYSGISFSGGRLSVRGVTFNPPACRFANAASWKTYQANVQKAVTEIRKTLGGVTDRFSVALAIHDYLCDLLEYNYSDMDNIDNQSTVGAFLKSPHLTVCAGYARSFKTLCDRFGIPCVCVAGMADGGSHMWNYIQMEDGKWYLVDVTYDDQGSWTAHNYFLIGSASSGFGTAISSERTISPWWTPGGIFSFAVPGLNPSAYQIPKFAITAEPQGATAASAGQTLTVGVKATGIGLRYRWQYQWANNSSTWTDFSSGNGAASIKVKMYNASYNGIKVRCVVTDGNGETKTSKTAVLKMNIPVTITSQPSDQTVSRTGKSVTLSLKASGIGLKYSWQYHFAGSSTWTAFRSGNGKSSIRFTMYKASYEGIRVRCVVKDSAGKSAASRTAVLHIDQAPTIAAQPSDKVSPRTKKTVTVSLKAYGMGVKYRWQYQWKKSRAWKTFASGNGKSSIRVYMASSTYDGIKVRCILTDSKGRKVTSRTATIRIAAAPKITVQPKNLASAGPGKALTVSLQASGAGLKYQWQYQWAAGTTWKSFVSGNGKPSIRVSMADRSYQGIRIRCIVTDGAGRKVTSDAATMTFSGM